MISLLSILFFAFLSFFLGVYVVYYAYLRANAKRPWKINIDEEFRPEISILIPVHNEEKAIEPKLRNISRLSYPKDKIEVLIADDDSTDRTLAVVRDFIRANPEFDAKIVKQNPRAGKSAALNMALTVSSKEIVVVSDADTLWPDDILQKALPYMSSPEVGAITSRGINKNAETSWTTRLERTYLDLTYLLRLGESKIHSTLRFEGGFCAYKKSAFEKFDCETGSDDSGTALDVVQHNRKAILAPEAVFCTWFPTRIGGKLKIKARRAVQLVGLWTKCFKLMLKRRLLLPKSIALANILLFIVNPVVFLALIITTSTIILLSFGSLLTIGILLLVGCSLLLARGALIEISLENLVLLYALLAFTFGRRYVAWEDTSSPRGF